MKHLLKAAVVLLMLHSAAYAQIVLVPSTGSATTTACSGTIQDHAGNGIYSNSVNGFLVIDPPGNATVSLSFTQFQTESGYDYVRIYNGVGITGTLLGSYSGSTLPNGGNPFVSTSGAMTVRFSTDGSGLGAGFTANFTAAGGSTLPVASFTVSTLNPAFNTPVQFTNTSSGGTFLWLFGDGTTSTAQNPMHAYTTSGPKQVRLVATNCNGVSDTSGITTLNVQAGPNGAISIDTLQIAVPCGGTNSTSFNISNSGTGNLNYSLNLSPSAASADFLAPFEGTGLDGFVNQNPTYYTTALKTTNAAKGNQYLEFSGDGGYNDGLKANFPASQPTEVSYYVKSDNYGTTNGNVEIGGLTSGGSYNKIFNSVFSYTTMYLYYGYGTGSTYYYQAITQGTWYHIELKNINYTTERFDLYVNGVMVVPNAEFYYPAVNLNEVQVFSTYIGTIGLDDFYIGNQNITNALTYSPSTGVLANGNNVTVFVNANAAGLNAGTYWMDMNVTSNDVTLNGMVIPVELTVTGDAQLVQSASCVNYGNVYNTQTFTDSMLVWNTGCDTLNVNLLSTSSANLSVSTTPFDLAPNDSSYVFFGFSPSTLGAFADTIYMNGPDTNSYICVSAMVAGAPLISTDSTSYHVNFSGCPDTVSFPFIIYNTGLSALNWGTSGTVSGNKSDNFEGASINTNLWASWTSGISQGTSCGVIAGSKSLIIYGTGGVRSIQTVPLNTSAGGTISFKYNQSSCDNAETGEGIYVFYSINNGSTWTQIQYFYSSNTITQTALMPIPVGAQGSNVIFKLQQSVNSGTNFDHWTVDDFEITSGISNSMIFTPDTGAVAVNGSVNVLAKVVTTGLSNGTYNLFAYISSNDPVNPVLTLPVTLTINGIADMDFASACKQVAATIVLATTTDSVMVYNSGCADLTITNAAFSTTNFGATTTTATVLVGDTAYLKFNFVPQTIGAKTDSLAVTSNAGAYKICVSGIGLGAPVAVAATTPINVTLNGCADSSVVLYSVGNTGQSALNYKFLGQGNDTIKILAMTIGMGVTNYNNAVAALNTYMKTPFVITTTNTTSPATLTSLLVGKDLLWMPPNVSAQYANFTNLSTAIQSYVSNGGRYVVNGTGYTGNILNSGVIQVNYALQDAGGVSLSVNPLYASDPVVNFATGTSLVSANKTYYYDILNSVKRQLMRRTSSMTEDFVTEVTYGSGKGILIGFDFFGSNSLSQQVMANAMEVYGQGNGGGSYADWLSISPDSGQVATNSSTNVSFTFKAGSRGSGTYTDTVLIETNDPLKPLIKVPVVLTINGSAEIDVTANCVAFTPTLVGVTNNLPTSIYNAGCDTLIINGSASATGNWSILNLPLKIAPRDSMAVDLSFLPLSMGTFQDTLQIFSNADTVGICVSGQGLGAPQVNPAVDTLRVTVNKCDGFKIVPFTVQNSGQGSMTYAMDAISLYQKESTKNYTTLSATTLHSFLNTPATADTIFFMIVVNGDFNSNGSGEFYYAYAEGYNLGIYDNNAPDGTNDTSYGYYTGPNIATWLADGKLEVTVVNSSGVALNTGLDMHYVQVRMKSIPSWLSFLSPKTGTLAIGASTTKNLLFTATNLSVGTYTSSVVIESNDPVNPIYTVPVVLKVVDKPEMDLKTNCIQYGQVVGTTPVKDSVMVYNKGCQNLNITNLQFTNPVFTSTITTAVIAAGDSMWVPIILTPVAAGPLNASVLIYSNDTNLSVCLTANVNFMPVAGYDFQVIDDCGGKVDFNDITTNNPVNWNWNFGDGKISLAQNPTHTFAKPGIYNVRLISWNTSGVDTVYKTVDMSKVLYASFDRPDTIRGGVAAQFYDSCLVATQWQWYFGDGGSSTLQNPIHTYANAGVYFVSFIASNADCSKTINKQVTVYSGFGIEENEQSTISIYPVPATDFVFVEWNVETHFVSARVLDAVGNQLSESTGFENALKIDASNFAAGIYFVVLADNYGKTVVKKFVISR